MRIVKVWVVAISIIFMVSVGWYATLPVVIGISSALNSTITIPEGRNAAKSIEYAAYAWGPILITFVLLWAVVASQRRDVESNIWN